MADQLQTGDRVRAYSSWNDKSQGKGTVVTTTDSGAGVELDKAPGAPAHFYTSELTKIRDHR